MKEMSPTIFPAPPSRVRLLSSVLTMRTLWGAMVGAIMSILACSVVSLISWQTGIYSRALIVVWPADIQTAAWHGALPGLLVGWLARTPKQAGVAAGLSAMLLVAYDWKSQRAVFIAYQNLFDFSATLHYLFYAVLICSVIYCILARHDREIERRRQKPEENSMNTQPDMAIRESQTQTEGKA